MNLAYLTDIIILLAAAVITVPLARVIGLGTVPGFLLAGIVVGPSALSLIDNAEEIRHLAELGVVLLLFIIGIELKPSRLWVMRRLVFGLGTLQVVVTGALITLAAAYLFGLPMRSALLIGPALALSSTAFVLQLLTEQKMLMSSYGRGSIAVLLFQDLAVVPLLALVSLLAVPELSVTADVGLALVEGLVILALIILGGRYLLQPVLHRVALFGSPEVFTATAVLLVLGTATVMAHIGLSMAMGAFVAGLLVADSEFRHQVVAEIQPFRGLLIGLFFMSMGMALSLELFLATPLIVLCLVVLLMALKTGVLFLLARLFTKSSRIALAVSLLLAQSGEFALVLFALAFESGLLDALLFQQLLLVVILSMLMTPPLAKLANRLALAAKTASAGAFVAAEDSDEPPILLAGFGRVGRRVGQILEMRGIRYAAVDNKAALVQRERLQGRKVFYGDARQLDVLRSMGAAEARLVIVTVDDFKANEEVVEALHVGFPDLKIISRGHDLEHCVRLTERGAALTVSENLEASIALAQEALVIAGEDREEVDDTVERFRQEYYGFAEKKSQTDPAGTVEEPEARE
jgi:monovalent cation:proton antiporter-2 (CPA2) family protein